MSVESQNLQTLIFSLIEQTKSRLDVVCEYVKANPKILDDSKIWDRLYELDEVLASIKSYGV